MEREFVPGIYRHFKGDHLYEALCVAYDSEDHERRLVVYRSLESGKTWVRPYESFVSDVEREGYSGPRFIYQGPRA